MSAVRNIDSVRLITSLYDAALNCDNLARKEAVRAHFTVLGALKCGHQANGVRWSRYIVVKVFEAFY